MGLLLASGGGTGAGYTGSGLGARGHLDLAPAEIQEARCLPSVHHPVP